MSQATPKPVSENLDPQITFLPRLTPGRKLARHVLRAVLRGLVWLFIDLTVYGRENIDLQRPILVVSNHLGDADLVIGVIVAPQFVEVMGKAELRSFPVLGWLMDLYGVIWVHRGQPDRRALRAVMQSLEQGRPVGLAPEGRESVTGVLEEGTHGAAFLALKTGAPILPITFTGTENWRVYGNMKRLRRTLVTLTVGKAFHLPVGGEKHADLERGTQIIMQTLAGQLPAEYRGAYQDGVTENETEQGPSQKG